MPDRGSSTFYDGRPDGAAVGAMIGKDLFSHTDKKGRRKTGLVGRAAGAAIGGAIGKSIGNMFTTKCKSMKIIVKMENPFIHEFEFTFINDDTPFNSDDYQDELKTARKCMEILAEIVDDKNQHSAQKQARLLQHQTDNQHQIREKERDPEE